MAVFQSMSFSLTMSIENLSAAMAVRLPLRVWSMNNLPSWMVNSTSCTSLKCFSRMARTFNNSANACGILIFQTRDGFRRANTGDDIFTLRIDQEFAVEFIRAIGGIACERHAGPGIVAGVSVNHRLHIDGGPHSVGMLYLRR